MDDAICPICGGGAFADFNGRRNARCLGCGSLERGRQQWMVLQRRAPLAPGMAVAHFAPERFFMDAFARRPDIRYRAFDKAPEHYPHPVVTVEGFDLCTDTGRLPSDAFDLVIHNHVLEHLPCAPGPVLLELKRILRPGGVMLFSVPIVGDRSIEGLDPATTAMERALRAAQGEHLRIFGRVDFPAMLRQLLGDDGLQRQRDLFNEAELRRGGVPPAGGEPNGKSVFLYRKPIEAVRI